jgi:alpha-1,3-rhamnosyl/mannosyltransferase
VIFTHALSDDDLAILVKGARLAVVPSLYEGFCLPMVEAMACGVPTIVANSSCLPEISGSLLRYFDPRSVDEMAVCIDQALEDETLRNELAAKGLRRASDFDWEQCARETMAVLGRVALEGKR